PEYVALSYTWRASRPEDEVLHEITFSDRYRKKITRNLLLAMRMLRHLGHLTVWIDQLSINQEDLGERGEQVRSMAQIYSRASKVVIYLGEENETSLAALKCLPEALRFIQQCREAEAEGRDPKLIPGLRLGRDALEAWMGIYDYPWFKRVWVVQETLLAKQ
ncbi:heterokaryon incompatibility, partial [Immersiella caudata]